MRVRALIVLAGLVGALPAFADPDAAGGLDLSVDVAPWGLFEFEDPIGPSAGVTVAGEFGGGFGAGALYRGLGSFGGMAGAFGRFASTPTLVKGKPFVLGFLDAGFVAGLGGLGGGAIYASGTGCVGYAASESVGVTAGLGLTTFVGTESTSSVQVPVLSLGVAYRSSKDD